MFQWKGFETQLVFRGKFLDTPVKDAETFIQTFATLEKKKRALLKQGCHCINKDKQKLLSFYHQIKNQCCKLLREFTIKFITCQE